MLRRALASCVDAGEIVGATALVAKLERSEQSPAITIGVHGGLVQWVMGNPFPIRICDYDGERADLPDIDERNQRCTISFAPADVEEAA